MSIDRDMNMLFKSIVLTSDDPATLATFYRDVLELPLEEERHRGTLRHWACQVGSLHFAIHERATFWLASKRSDAEGTVVSFTVENIDEMAERLASRGITIHERTKIGPMSFLAVRDPDGRYVCFGTPWPARKPAT